VETVTDRAERIAFLANSEHRIAILRALYDQPQAVRTLRDRTDASRATIGRVLNDFVERNWIRKENGKYAITPAGELVVEEFTPLLESMDRVAVLEEVGHCLPVDELSVPLRELGDAEVIRPTDGNPHSHIDYAVERIHETTDLLAVVDSIVPRYLEAVRDCTVDGTLRSRQVCSASVLETVERHDEMAANLREILAADGDVWRCEESISVDLLILDESVLFVIYAETGPPEAFLETDNRAVVKWATQAVESYRAGAVRLDGIDVPA
jgi:predicted transcriptional regulator